MEEPATDYRATPDFNFWCKQSGWTIDEALALSLGLDPDIVNLEIVERDDFPLELKQEYRRRRALFSRALSCNQFPYLSYPGPPVLFPSRDFVDWTESNGIQCSSALKEAFVACGFAITNWKLKCDALKAECDAKDTHLTALEEKCRKQETELNPVAAASVKQGMDEIGLHPRARRSLLTILLGIAVAKYHYNGDAKRSDVPEKLSKLIEEAGFDMTDDTVRAYLQEAWKKRDAWKRRPKA